MVKSTFKQLLFIIPIATILQSCEGETDRYRKLINQSTAKISIKAEGYYTGSLDTTILPGASLDLFLTSQRGGSNYIENPSWGLIYLKIFNHNLDSCKKNYRDSTQWKIRLEHVKKAPSYWKHEYTFSVLDSDF